MCRPYSKYDEMLDAKKQVEVMEDDEYDSGVPTFIPLCGRSSVVLLRITYPLQLAFGIPF
jgi:hypothetical protein